MGCGNSESRISKSETELEVDSIFLSHHFNRDVAYEPISLIYNEKPILSPGQKVQNLDSTLSFRYDPNGDFWNAFNLIADHLSLDDDLSIALKQGSINGIFFFSSDQIGNQIFNISGNWTIGTELTDSNQEEIIHQFTENLFPILKGKLVFEKNWNFENRKKGYIEYFSTYPPKGKGFYWTIDYQVKMK